MQSIMTNRTIFSDNSSLTDISRQVSDYKASNWIAEVVAAEDYLYLGSDFPFNHRWIEVATPNDATSAITVSCWDGESWIEATDVIDQTSVGGVTLAQSGYLSFRPSEDEGWDREDTNDDGDFITGLTDVKIYGLYWIRIQFSGDLNPLTAIKYIGHKFSSDDDLQVVYPILLNSQVIGQFETGKTTWDDQHFYAADEIIKELKRKNISYGGNQILDWSQFRDASVHKVATMAFRSFGKDFQEELKDADGQFVKAMNTVVKSVIVDSNLNAIVDGNELRTRQGYMKR